MFFALAILVEMSSFIASKTIIFFHSEASQTGGIARETMQLVRSVESVGALTAMLDAFAELQKERRLCARGALVDLFSEAGATLWMAVPAALKLVVKIFRLFTLK